MDKHNASSEFKPLNIAILTISDTRDEATDSSGRALAEGLLSAGHKLAEKLIVPDDIYIIRRELSRWIADDAVQAVISNGGTGLTGRDGTPEAVAPLLDRTIDGFGELFRWFSLDEVGTSTIASRAIAGVANATFIFCLPGSTNACRTGWNRIIEPQLDSRNRPCNLSELLPRLKEH
ncbi:MAG: molybdenum cofactor biosynthesis protein B [Gammaproteobacteria bacterium]